MRKISRRITQRLADATFQFVEGIDTKYSDYLDDNNVGYEIVDELVEEEESNEV